MNELRMYVEHLFRGKVLTDEIIELKEEIYGNLVARYEDYVAGGMEEAEALAKTKASITSIDDVIAGEAPVATTAHDAPAAGSAASGAAGEAAARTSVPAAAGAGGSAGDAAAAADDARAVDATAAAAHEPHAPRLPFGAPADAAATTAKPARRVWPKVAAIAAVIVAVCVIGAVAIGATFGAQRQSSVARANAQRPSASQGGANASQAPDANSADGNAGTTGNGAGGAAGNGAGNGAAGYGTDHDNGLWRGHHYWDGDADDHHERAATRTLCDEIDAGTASLLAAYASRNTPAEVRDLVAELPLGAYRSDAGIDTQSDQRAYINYTQVPDAIDGDVIDSALLYNVAAILAVYPQVNEVRISLQEVDDSPQEGDLYTFARANVEHGLANASGNTLAALNDGCFASEDAWNQVRDYVCRENFCDRQIDLAEHD